MNAVRTAAFLIFGSAAAASAQQAGWRASADARLIAGYFDQNTRAGEHGITTSTWLLGGLGHAQRRYSLDAHVMLSGDALLNGECGQPRLLPQTFHCGDVAAISHPLVMHLGVGAEVLTDVVALKLGVSAVGEPAFGPVPHFMRASARFDPGEPLTHHYFNPAHSAQGVVTIGAARSGFRLEVSAFNPEAATDAYRIESGPLSGGALRLAYSRSRVLELQLSAAYFPASDEAGQHGHGGAMRAYSLTANGSTGRLDYTAGCAAHRTVGHTPTACLAEAAVALGVHRLFARLEVVDRLEQTTVAVIAPDGSHVHTVNHYMMKSGEVAGGYAWQLPVRLGWQPAFGMRAAVTTIPAYFRQRYLEDNGTVATFFVSLRPARTTPHVH